MSDHTARTPATASTPGRHRARRGTGPRGTRSALWPLTALVVVGLVGASTLRGTPLPDDGSLARPADALISGAGLPAPLSPEGLATLHTAGYAWLTRAFSRHATLVGAEREMLLVLLLGGALLLWRTARRLDLPEGACAVALVCWGGFPVLAPLHAAAIPAAFAVPWLLLAGWLGSRARATVPLAVPAVSATVLAVLLAPDVLLLLVAGAAVAVGARTAPGRRRVLALTAGLVAAIGVRLLVQVWNPQPGDPARWDAGPTGLMLLAAVLVLTGALSVWALPRFRPAGTALAATALLAVAPPSGRLPALLVSLPLAGLLVGALATAAAERVRLGSRRPRALLAAAVAAGVVLAGLGTAGATGLAGAPASGPGAADDDRLVAWAAAQLPPDATLTASDRLAAELVRAGADPGRVRAGSAPAGVGGPAPGLLVTEGGPPPGSAVVARFGRLTVAEPQPAQPSAEQVAARRDLAAALLANPTTHASAADADRLAAGQVDPRLLTLLAGIGAQYGLGLHSLPAVPGEPAGAPARQAVVRASGGRSLTDDPAAVQQLRRWLDVQKAPFRPDRVEDVDGGLLVGYDLVRDPDALLPGSGGG